ncbi:hypothetical protein [Dactylosporangium salmoneum]|uniref:Uncharacterized protein n=1 Tax=Dactylosporangium salmoneum TaxID=53361 RepID=A0ABN3G8H9_9ACTN
MRVPIVPLDPDTPEGLAAAEALTAFLAEVRPAVRQRRREREAAAVVAVHATTKRQPKRRAA